ncbi:hypothetical protein [Flavihumibacter profundi]|uniref:hypothetical protein n=1 Tax=Flavihumibacter profundi TaxID=2716883 RepID=UPI001CC75F08|nr:hypothetical protein [Flavihumibacter profundi]MBZ5857368.1 hypothetical protein [Flavihumibacter profundi]
MASTRMYSIPEKFRKIENLHILFWLIKDMSWAMLWKPLGILMIIPTLTVALLITWQTRKLKSELYHNLAVAFWIIANCYWMSVEFLEAPDYYRYFAAIPFTIGFLFIASYYIFIRPTEEKNQKTVTISIDVPEDTLHLSNT